VLGICNGFQILCEAQLLPGALTRNRARRFINREVTIRMENTSSAWTRAYLPGQEITVVLKSGEGAYMADQQTLAALEAGGQVLARYAGVRGSPAGLAEPQASPNGSVSNIAGVVSESGTVAGLMPHPEHAIDLLTGPSEDGLAFFTSVLGVGTPA
jgi:phosphoribosylformylglycinamidine (FGAM) synthase-like amidotransferase family enzyme